jgi:tRNA pseudouridine55 synthase
VHVDGKRAYRLARKGRPVVLESKPVRIERLEITGYEWPRLAVEIECSSGTFVRALGRDLAESLGTKAVMESLVRTAVGPFACAASIALDAITPETARAAILPAGAAVAHLPSMVLADDALASAVRGGLLQFPESSDPAVAALDPTGELVGMLKRLESGSYRLRPNFLGEG